MKFLTLSIVAGLVLGAIGACSSDSTAPVGSSPGNGVTTTIGDQGGEVEVNGASLQVPEGALSEDTQIGVERLSGDAAADFRALLPADQALASPIYVFTPHGSQFEAPVTITLDYSPGSPNLSVLRLDDEQDQTWQVISEDVTFAGGEASFETTHFSLIVVTRQVEAVAGGDAGVSDAAVDASNQPNSSVDAASPDQQSDSGAIVDGDFEVVLRSPEVTIAQGQQGFFDVVATRAPGFVDAIDVSIDGLPQGVTWVEGQNVIVGQDLGTLVTLAVDETAALGETAVTLVASAGNTTRMLQGTLIVSAPVGTFTIGVLPYQFTIARGASAEATLTLTPANGFEGVVDLALEFEPEGVTVSPLMVEMSGTEPTVQVLTFSAAETTPVGTGNVMLNGTTANSDVGAGISIGITIE